jgi:hypothetical protein
MQCLRGRCGAEWSVLRSCSRGAAARAPQPLLLQCTSDSSVHFATFCRRGLRKLLAWVCVCGLVRHRHPHEAAAAPLSFLAHLFVSVSDLGIGLVGGGWVAVVEWQGSERLHTVHGTNVLSRARVSGLAHQRRTAGKWADTMSASVYAPIAEAPGWGADELDPVVVVMPPARTKSKMPTVWDNRCDAPPSPSSRVYGRTSAAGGTTLSHPTVVVVVSLHVQSPPFTTATSPALPLSHSAQLPADIRASTLHCCAPSSLLHEHKPNATSLPRHLERVRERCIFRVARPYRRKNPLRALICCCSVYRFELVDVHRQHHQLLHQLPKTDH